MPPITPELVIAAITTASQLIQFLVKIAADLKQSEELTPEQDQALDEAIKNATNLPNWKIEE